MQEKTHIRFNGVAAICDRNKKGVSFEAFFSVHRDFRCDNCERKLRQHGYVIHKLEERFKNG